MRLSLGNPIRHLMAVVVLPLLIVVLGCGDAADGAGVTPPTTRPADGLVTDPELQSIVRLQIARDGAALVEALAAPRAEVRARAALALASVQDSTSLGALAAALAGDEEAAVRRDAALALGQLGMDAAVEPLRIALPAESDPAVRLRILEALGKVPSPAASGALLAAEIRASEEGARALALSVNAAVKGIVTPQVYDFLLARLDDPDPGVRRGAAYYFGRTDDVSAWRGGIERVRAALMGYGFRDEAAIYLVQALGKVGDEADVGRFAHWSQPAADWRVRNNAVAALRAHGGTPQAIEALLTALFDSSPHVAAAAAGSLEGHAHLPSTIARIATIVSDRPARLSVAEPLLRILAAHNEREPLLAWVDSAPDGPSAVVGLRAVAGLPGQDALDRLLAAAADGPDDVRANAVVSLGRRWAVDRRDPAMHPVYYAAFAGALSSGVQDAEFGAAQALTDPLFLPLGSAEAIATAYRSHAADEDPQAASELLRLLSLAQAPESEALLREALAHPGERVRRMAAMGLERLTGQPVEYDETEDPAPTASGPAFDAGRVDWGYLESLGSRPTLTFETEAGSVVMALAPEEAPQTVQAMTRLAAEGRFDGIPFHRVIANFVVQGGDVARQEGRGGPGFTIRSEFNGLAYVRGAIGMASAGKDTEGSQFFIAHTRLPHLDGGYTVFGWVVSGMDVVDQIEQGDLLVSATFSPGG